MRSIPLDDRKTVLHVDGHEPGIIEFEIAWPGSAAADLLGRFADRQTVDMLESSLAVATLDELYTLKLSHRYLKNSPHFLKTMRDIQLMRSHGARVFDRDWLKQRESETYVYKHPKLNVMKKDFFTGDGVEYVYDHDTIHKAVAHCRDWAPGDSYSNPTIMVPAYTLYMKDGEEVKSDKGKFFGLSEQVRLWGVLEEAQVLALERSQIPFRGKVDPRRSFDIALSKVCTSITSGWFREYAWENFDRVNELYEPDYVDRFWKAVDDGIVRKL